MYIRVTRFLSKNYFNYTKNVPRVLILCIKSYRFISVCAVPVNEIALALLIRMSIPPNYIEYYKTNYLHNK